MHSFKSIHKAIQDLVEKHSLKRVLIGLSGGPDSMALLSSIKDVEIAIAHVDHRWREESAREASQLKSLASAHGIPFYLKVLDCSTFQGNLEDRCREERLQFFSEICQKEGYEAVMLGHHRDDLAETVLKRVLEGACFSAIEGIRKSTKWKDLLILRPFLEIPKQDLICYLKTEKIAYFEDQTNLDPQFLRGKMRSKILPELEAHFGKSVSAPLMRLSRECQDLNAYLHERLKPFLTENNLLDCQMLQSEFEVRWVLRNWLKSHGMTPSYEGLKNMAKAVMTKRGDLKFLFGEKKLEIDRGRIFLHDNLCSLPEAPYLIHEGQWGSWKVQIDKVSTGDVEVCGWQAAWKGRIEFFLPEGDFFLQNYATLSSKEKKKLQKLWTDRKVPAFFREFVPIVSNQVGFVREFLTGQEKKGENFSKKVILYLE